MMNVCNKKILMLAYHYPPANNGGTVRPFQFAKYLPNFSYEPIIVTTSKFGNIKNEKNIHRYKDSNTKNETLFKKIKRKVLYELGFISSHQTIWKKEVLLDIINIIQKEGIDIVWITFPPAICFDIAIELKKKLDIPIISDFRDGYVYEPLKKENFIRSIANKRIEQRIVDLSEHIITVSPSVTKYFKTTYGIDNVTTITNGYDNDLGASTERKEGNIYRIVYTGRLSLSYKDQSIKSFIEALVDIVNTESKIRVDFIIAGELTKQELNYFRKKIPNNFQYRGLVTREESIELQKQADLLLFSASSKRKSIATTKLYEYISVNRPIFALTKGTFAEDIIKSTRTGICLDPNDKSKVKIELSKIIEENTLDWFNPNFDEIEKYNRQVLTKKLANIFDSILDGGSINE